MGQTLDNGIYLPSEGERNCYEGLAGNWVALDNHLGSTNIHVTINDKQAWDGHVADSVKHVTAEDKAKWDAVTSKANDSDVVHKSGNETVGGVKTFTDNTMIKTSSPKVLLINTSQTGNTAPSSNTASFFRFDGGTVNNFGGVQCEFLTTGENRLTNYVKDITTAKINSIQQRANSTTAMTVFNADLIVPATDGITVLGNSSKHWSDVNTYKVNNLEPSSLSLPSDRSARIDISSYITNLGNGGNNTYTVPANGYIWLHFTSVSGVVCYSQTSGGLTNYAQTFARYSGEGQLYAFFPVRKDDKFVVQIYTSSTAVVQNAFFIPCQGNV